MKKIFAILALVGAVAVGSAQNVAKPGLYDKYGNVVVAEDAPVVVSFRCLLFLLQLPE